MQHEVMRKKVPMSMKFDADLWDRLGKFQNKMQFPPTITLLVETAVRDMLDKADREAKRK